MEEIECGESEREFGTERNSMTVLFAVNVSHAECSVEHRKYVYVRRGHGVHVIQLPRVIQYDYPVTAECTT